jgi:hypothetical protein
MGCYAVAAMLEEPPSVACRHLVESSAHRLYERLAGTCPGPPQERLELGKRFDAIPKSQNYMSSAFTPS